MAVRPRKSGHPPTFDLGLLGRYVPVCLAASKIPAPPLCLNSSRIASAEACLIGRYNEDSQRGECQAGHEQVGLYPIDGNQPATYHEGHEGRAPCDTVRSEEGMGASKSVMSLAGCLGQDKYRFDSYHRKSSNGH